MTRFLRFLLLGAVLCTVPACDLSFDNPNAAGESEVLSTPDGLRALAVGMRRTYAVTTYNAVVRTSGLTAREFAVVVGFTNPQEIELGGDVLPPENGILGTLWSSNYRVMDMAEQLIANVEVFSDPATQASFRAYGHLFKAMALGNLAQFYEQYPISIDPNGDATFESRERGLQEAVSLLEAALGVLSGQTVPTSFQRSVLGTDDFDLVQTLNAYLARYQNMLGNQAEAISAAQAALADPSAVSVFVYEAGNGNENPLFLQTTEEPATLRPLDNFGFDPAEFVVPFEDGRLAFYLESRDEIGESSRLPVETMRGFYDTIDEPIPLYLPGEMLLIQAEAQARQGNLGAAVDLLNQVRTKTDDPFGVNAGLPAYDGAQTPEAVLEDIYRNRRVELFLTGLSLEDSRRFARPAPPSPPTFDSFNRNRNFYPYPEEERDNNPNVPADPAG
ncbi:MAG: RagB/SusD family nutrient uptake outer membrane protein [Bacteroidota bacterium]